MIFSYPQIVLSGWVFYTVCVHMLKHDDVKTKTNFYISGAFWLLEVFLLSKGGFFLAGLEWPQITWGVLAALGLISGAARHGASHHEGQKYSGPFAVIAGAITFTIYYFGGFFG
jgi:hypothetical protein